MARRPRLQIPGAVYHVMSRGNRKGPIFQTDDDRRAFMATVAETAPRYSIRLYALCLMGNHYHIVLATPRGNLSDAMRQLNGLYTQRYNRRHTCTGHVFEGRYRSILVQRENYLRRAVRYVVRNPQRAGLTNHPAAWPWSTYRATAGLESAPDWLDTQWMAWAFKAENQDLARTRFITYVQERLQKKTPVDWHDVAAGNRKFIARHAELAKARRVDRLVPRAAYLASRPALSTLFSGVTSRAERDRVIALAHVGHGYHLAAISTYLGFHPAMASRAFRRFTLVSGSAAGLDASAPSRAR